MDPLTITRSLRIDADTETVWASVVDAEGLAGWLGAAVDVEVTPGGAGLVRDHDGTTRQLVVTEVAERRLVGFVWWDRDEPGEASRVAISVVPDGDGTRVTVTETLAPAAAVAFGALGGRASAFGLAEVDELAGLGARWDDRLSQLLGAVSATALVAVGA